LKRLGEFFTYLSFSVVVYLKSLEYNKFDILSKCTDIK